MAKEGQVPVLLRIPKPTKRRLDTEAKRRQMSRAVLIRQILLEYLAKKGAS
jgi:predicted transcriptional regulator